MPKFDLTCVQKDAVIIPFRITIVSSAPVISEGGQHLAVTDGGAGIFPVTFTGFYGKNSARVPVVLLTAVTDTTGEEVIANVISPSVSGFTIEVNDDAGTGVDRGVHGVVIWFGTIDPQ